MKSTSAIKISVMLAVILGAACTAATEARADYGQEGRGRIIRVEKIDIRRDEERIHRLEFRMKEEMRCHDYAAARITRLEILDARRDLERDRRELDRIRRDAELDRRYRDDHYHDGYRVRD
jgi:hypothetical protein